jgi:hypothetical protein
MHVKIAPKDFYLGLLFFVLSITTTAARADSLKIIRPSLSAGFQVFTGFIIPHTESVRSISNSNPWGVEANLAWHYSDEKARSYCNCFPRLGIAMMYINFDNPSILGNGFTLAPFVEPFLPIRSKWLFSIRFSAGGAYLTRVYHPVTNPENLFYSTNFSYLLSLSPAIVYQLSQNWNLRISADYNHISNGGNQQPNKGINFPTASIGMDYIFEPVDFTKRMVYNYEDVGYKHTFRIIVSGTGKTPSYETNKRNVVFGLNSTYGRTISRLSILTAGVEFVNDGALKAELHHRNPSPPDHKRAALLAGHELMIGKFSFSQQLGFYFYSPAKPRDPVYQRWGLDYHISRKVFAGINLKAHRHVADFMDFRIGLKY